MLTAVNPLVLRLGHGGALDGRDFGILNAALTAVRRVPAKTTLMHDGVCPTAVQLVLDGFACCSKILPSGRRSITAFLVPGDLCGLCISLPVKMDHTVTTLSAATIAEVPLEVVATLLAEPRIAQALWWTMLVDAAVLRAWLVSVGQRRAIEQLAHLFCELYYRLKAVGVAKEKSYPLPLTNEEMADALGMTSVHVSRMLQRLRDESLIELKDRVVVIRDLERLQKLAQFDPNYLQLKTPAKDSKTAAVCTDSTGQGDIP